MKVFQLAAIAFTGLALAGCKTELNADIPLSALLDSEVASVPGTVRLEVLNCNDYEDSRQPSDSLVKAQEILPTIFPGAEFTECYSQNMNSWAEFNIDLPIDRDDNSEAFASDDSFNITTTENLPLGVAAPPALLNRMEKARESEMMMPDFEYGISFNVINDTDDVFPVTVLSAWADDIPLTLQGLNIPAGEQFTLRLSDVVIDRAIYNGEASVLIDLEKLIDQRG
ncbi:hypothetical protein QT231_18270 [Halomonas sp. SpR1]|uniref:DUF7424 family protein n=1 Tax=Halomonas sp. SpR1 TaxID=3050462 RepID=UPI0027E5544F|nr:hypothetical protein [Halomonas sp. SpR1]MDQ7734659.1 hypothetical protein [Halomonas sp. SpR1]